MVNLYYPTLDLFVYNLREGLGVDKAQSWYRHKIWFAYQKNRQLKPQIQESFNQVVPDIKNSFQYRLSELKVALQKNLQILSSYGTNLRSLEIQIQTIQLNGTNYEIYLSEL